MPAAQALAGGSCEPCKKKKCRCDRRIPICGQCAGTTLSCNYAENNKRGIPTGYLGQLEQRLAKTESALHNALTELRALRLQGAYVMQDHEKVFPRPILSNKASRMKEWRKYPLNTSHDVDMWWQEVWRDRSLTEGQHRNTMQEDAELLVREQQVISDTDTFENITNSIPSREVAHSESSNNINELVSSRTHTAPQDSTSLSIPASQTVHDNQFSYSENEFGWPNNGSLRSAVGAGSVQISDFGGFIPQGSAKRVSATQESARPERPQFAQAQDLTQTMSQIYY